MLSILPNTYFIKIVYLFARTKKVNKLKGNGRKMTDDEVKIVNTQLLSLGLNEI